MVISEELEGCADFLLPENVDVDVDAEPVSCAMREHAFESWLSLPTDENLLTNHSNSVAEESSKSYAERSRSGEGALSLRQVVIRNVGRTKEQRLG